MNGKLTDIIRNLGRPKVLVVGDLIMDRYIMGKVQRISPESPIPILEVDTPDRLLLGGAANVANNLVALEADVVLAGVLGDDDSAMIFRQLCQEHHIDTSGIMTDPKRPTTTKTRVVAGTQQVVRIDRESRSPLHINIARQFHRFFMEMIPKVDVVVISDYNKGVLCSDVLHELIFISKKEGKQVLVDPKGRDYSRYRGVTLLTPNKKEAAEALGIEDMKDEVELRGAGINIMRQIGSRDLIITCGREGVAIFTDGEYELLPTEAREVFDVTGAGDTFISMIAICKAKGVGLREAARLANIAAGIVVGKTGVATVTREEILRHIEESYFSQKIFSIHAWESLKAKLATERVKGARIVFTNGCFDLIHPGHLRLLRDAKKFGDVLVVGLNTDASIRRLKGEKRPILSEYERSHIISSLEVVDCVALFDEDTPENLIKALKPDVLVKGADYKKSEVVGADIVEKYGGKIELLPLLEGFSTTDIVERVLEKYKQ